MDYFYYCYKTAGCNKTIILVTEREEHRFVFKLRTTYQSLKLAVDRNP